ncbi:MAG: hypothetical protein ACRCZW_04020 [Lactobacillaceae bacterium]
MTNSIKHNHLKEIFALPLIALLTPALIAGQLGLPKVSVVAIIQTAYRAYKAGTSVRAAIAAATGGWGLAVSVIAQFGLAWLASQVANSWVIGF